jgi:hypothetical protein
MFQRFSRTGTALVSVCFASLLQLPCLADSLAGSEGWTSSSLGGTNQSGGFVPLQDASVGQQGNGGWNYGWNNNNGQNNGQNNNGWNNNNNNNNGHLWTGDNQYSPEARNGNPYGIVRGNTNLWGGGSGLGLNNSAHLQSYGKNAANTQTTGGRTSFKPFTVDSNGTVHTQDGRAFKNTAANLQKNR